MKKRYRVSVVGSTVVLRVTDEDLMAALWEIPLLADGSMPATLERHYIVVGRDRGYVYDVTDAEGTLGVQVGAGLCGRGEMLISGVAGLASVIRREVRRVIRRMERNT